MAEKRSKSDQYLLRLPPGLRAKLQSVADANARSLNAEIVERLEGYDLIQWRMSQLTEEKEKLAAQLDATRDALADQKKISDQLQHLIHMQSEDSQRDQETENVITEKFNELKEQSNYLERLKVELIELSKKRDELNADAAEIVNEQRAAIERLVKSQDANEKLIRSFQKIFQNAADGDDEQLKEIITVFRAMDEKDE